MLMVGTLAQNLTRPQPITSTKCLTIAATAFTIQSRHSVKKLVRSIRCTGISCCEMRNHLLKTTGWQLSSRRFQRRVKTGRTRSESAQTNCANLDGDRDKARENA